MRKARQLREGARYHVIARTNKAEMIRDASAMRTLFLDVVQRARRRYDFGIEGFCVMGYDFHFILQPLGGESLSAIMRWIMGVFAVSYNRAYGLSGKVWYDRYSSRIVPAGLQSPDRNEAATVD